MSGSTLKPFGNSEDPHSSYQLTREHLTWLAVRNFRPVTVQKRGVYVRAFALWCFERDLLSPLSLTKPQFEAFQQHVFRQRKSDGKPLAWSSQQ